MKKRLLNTISKAEDKIKSGTASAADVEGLKYDIAIFQHERLVHLIVSVFVGLCDMISIVIILLSSAAASFALSAVLTVLFIFYIAHYYTLENGTQKLYGLLDEMVNLARR
ncbi:MAG: hypothetical protein LBQ18_08735 [Campylobacteraceae bacterium]|jgi:hypothetical protein|nr:hypothetical protein [Campylobacteraceae bacterium]